MYEAFYAFTGNPFQLTPDSRFFFGSHEHRKAMSFLEYGISQREGFVVITGEIGAGKTTLVEHLLATLDSLQYAVARVVTTQVSGFDVLCMIGSAYGIFRDGMSKSALITRFAEFFSNLKAQRRYPLIIVDEAQSLTAEAIEELRMLSNLVAGSSAPFQGILLGQPEFRDSLSGPTLQQFRQRIIASCHLGALTEEDCRKYIEYRLARVGWTDNPTFSDDAFREIHRRSGGIPRRVNTLCSRLLLLGYLEESRHIDGGNVARVAEEMAAELGPMALAASAEVPITPISSQTAVLSACNGNPSYEPEPLREPPGESLAGVIERLSNLEGRTDTHQRILLRALNMALQALPHEIGD